MSRRLTATLAAASLLSFLCWSALSTVASAEDWKLNSPDTKRGIVSKASILSLVEKGKYEDAEGAYLEWVNAWHEDSLDCVVTIESQILLKQYADGNKDALFALLHAGDRDALTALRGLLKIDKPNVAPEELAAAIRAKANLSDVQLVNAIQTLGTVGDASDLPTLKALLACKDPLIVNAAIDGLGNLGDKSVLPTFYIMASDADITQSVTLARAMIKMGAAKELTRRYESQLHFPLKDMPQRAGLLLCIAGNPSGWKYVEKMLHDKENADTLISDPLDDTTPLRINYYPLVLSVLGNLPQLDVKQYVLDGLAGNEQEQTNALQSITALPAPEMEKKLTEIVANEQAPLTVRTSAVDILANLNTPTAYSTITKLAITVKDGNADVKAAAIAAMEPCGLLNDENTRASIRMQLLNDDPKVVMAARAALLAHARKVHPVL